jgi:hypothetical protein
MGKRDEKRAIKKSKISNISCSGGQSSSDLALTSNIGNYYCHLEESMVEPTTTTLSDVADQMQDENTKPCCISCQKQKPTSSFNRHWFSSSMPYSPSKNHFHAQQATGSHGQSGGARRAGQSEKSDTTTTSSSSSSSSSDPSDDLKLIFSHENNNRNNLFNKQFFQLNINSSHQQQTGLDKLKDNNENLCNNCWVIIDRRPLF